MGKVALYANDNIKLIDVFSKVVILKNDEFAPTYKQGDAVGIDEVKDLEPGEIGAYYINNELFIKIKGLGVLRSINPQVPDVPMDDNIRLVGKVIKKI